MVCSSVNSSLAVALMNEFLDRALQKVKRVEVNKLIARGQDVDFQLLRAVVLLQAADPVLSRFDVEVDLVADRFDNDFGFLLHGLWFGLLGAHRERSCFGHRFFFPIEGA